jgi:uncharacterized membrane protein YdbT with pleckstrin-like domain
MALKDTLLTDEKIVAETKKHWMAPVRDSWKPALLLIGAVIVNRLAPDESSGLITGTAATIMGWIAIGLAIAGLGWIVYNVVVWRTAAFAVTSMRVIREEGLISRRSSATLLRSLTDVQMKIPLIGSRLGYGDLAIMGQSGQTGADRFLTIVDPNGFRTRIMEAKAAADGPAAPASAPKPAAPEAPATPPAAPPAAATDDVDTLARLAELRDSGAITAEEYEVKKAEILSRL